MKRTLFVCFWLLFLSAEGHSKSWEHLFDHSQYEDAKISPDGKHLAVSLFQDGKTILVFFDSETMEITGTTRFQGRREVGEFQWVNDERVVLKIETKEIWRESPVFYGELYGVNYDGKKGELIYGYRAGETQTGSRIKVQEAIRGWAEVLDILPEDKKHILVSSTPMSETGESLATVFKLNVYCGRTKRKIATSPIPFAKFATDQDGNLRAVSGTDLNNNKQLYIKTNKGWDKVPSEKLGDAVELLSVSSSGKYLYTLDNYKQSLTGLFRLSLDTLEYKEVYTDKNVDISHVEMTTDGHTAFAMRVDEGYPAYLLFNKKHEEAQVFKSLLSVFPNNAMTITSRTLDGSKYVISTGSDVDPGKLYLFDKSKNALRLLFQYKEGLKNSELAQTEPFSFTSDDGLAINGFFTMAKSEAAKSGKIPPVVVLVHGGPHSERDYWEFSSKVQYLALNGFSVLQVNYRGSAGFGLDFERAGHKKWGTSIQQDIRQAYQWAVDNGKAKPGQACIMGESFGAYSAVQSVIKYPGVYKCAVANEGIYDLTLMFDKGDEQKTRSGRSYLRAVLGTEKDTLKANSPVNFADKINVPLLLTHGNDGKRKDIKHFEASGNYLGNEKPPIFLADDKEDKRAPYAHAERLRAALEKANKQYDWYVLDKDGKGTYSPESQKQYMKHVVKFLSQHLSI